MGDRTSLDDGRITFGAPDPHENESIDPVCGRRVDLSAAFAPKLERDAETYCFCSNACRALFESNPTAYPRGATPDRAAIGLMGDSSAKTAAGNKRR